METYRNTSSAARSRGQGTRSTETARVVSLASSAERAVPAAADGSPSRAASVPTRPRLRSNFMRYAADNRVVQAIYSFITGPTRFVFYGIVVVAIGIGVYFPARDLYAAYRTGDILERQLEIRTEYNENLESEVNLLLSTEGIEQVARERLGLVMPGEHAVNVVGADDEDDADGSAGTSGAADDADSDDASVDDAADSASDDASDSDSSSADASTLTTANDVEDAEVAAAEEAPWYIKLLDAVFFYDGVEGQTVSSTGA